MESFKRFVRGAFDRGGVLELIVGCLTLYIQQHSPNILRPVSIGIIAAGALLFGRYIIMEYNTTREDVRYQELLRKLEERLPDIEEHLHSSEEYLECFIRIVSVGERLLQQLNLPQIEDRIIDLLRILQEVKVSSCTTRTRNTLSEMRIGQVLSSASHSEEDIAVVNSVEYDGEIGAGYMQQEEQQTQQEDENEKRHEKIPEILLELITKAVQQGMPENVLHAITENVLDDLSEYSPLRIVLNEQFERNKEVFKKELAFIEAQEEMVKNLLAMMIAKEVVEKFQCHEPRMQEIFKNVFEEAKEKAPTEETDEKVLGEEAAGEIEDKKIFKSMSAKVIAKRVLKEVEANKALMQEIVKNVLQEAAKDMPPELLVKEVTAGKATPKMTVEEVVEEVLIDRYLIEDVLEKIFINVLPRKTEQKEEVKQKLRLKM